MLRLRRCVLDHWKDMRKEFRSKDPSGKGVLSPVEFRQILRNYNTNLTEEEFYDLMTYYDPKMQGQICYNDFIRAFLKTA